MSELVADGTVQRVGMAMRAPKTAELIATHLRRQIVRGELKPGETLPSEINLMEQFSVSRPTLREAFRILEAESIIGVRRGSRGGAQVLEPDPRVAARHVGLLLQLQGTTIQDVYEARMAMEPICASMLAARRTDEDVAALRAILADVEALLDASQKSAPAAADWSHLTYRFHEAIMQRCGNRTLAVQGAVLADIVDAHMQQSISRSLGEHSFQPERFQKTVKSYARAVDFIEKGDADGAAAHWRKHMEVAAQYVFLYDPQSKPVVDLFG